MPDAQASTSASRILARTQNRMNLTGRPIAPERHHVSLHAISIDKAQPETTISRACKAAANVVATRFTLTFDQALSFRQNAFEKPFVLCASEAIDLTPLRHFHRELGTQLAQMGVGAHVKESFTPHMTLLYDPLLVPRHRVDPVTWTVNDFVLIHSFVGLSRYEILKGWPLRAA
jgi:RNA 2',3'-cyclic 3'-phosphodiesterase